MLAYGMRAQVGWINIDYNYDKYSCIITLQHNQNYGTRSKIHDTVYTPFSIQLILTNFNQTREKPFEGRISSQQFVVLSEGIIEDVHLHINGEIYRRLLDIVEIPNLRGTLLQIHNQHFQGRSTNILSKTTNDTVSIAK